MSRKRNRNVADMGVDEFMSTVIDDNSDSDSVGADITKKSKRLKQKTPSEVKGHTKSLERLKKADPAFYKFLESEDKSLLQFSDNDDDEADESEDENIDEIKHEIEDDEEEVAKIVNELVGSDSDEDPIHVPPKKLEEVEVSSDDEEEECIEDKTDESEAGEIGRVKGHVTLGMIKRWSKLLQDTPRPSIIHSIVQALKICVARACNTGEGNESLAIQNSSVLNAIMKLCLTRMLPAIVNVLSPSNKSIQLDKPSSLVQSKGWKRMRLMIKYYLSELLKVLSQLSQSSMVDVLLKHFLKLTAFYACFPVLSRKLLKLLIQQWSEGGETTRVLAFLCINRLLRLLSESLLDAAIKKMYISYVRNCKFTSPTTLPVINFMQRTLVEVFAIKPAVTYQFAFIYIRQLAIHLRNAIIDHKADNIAAVYNWQYIHSMHLWVRTLCNLCPGDCLDALVYPLTQTIIGTIKLVPTKKFYPLRFHCVRSLVMLASSTNTFIPILPFILEVFEQTDFHGRHKNISVHPINFATILKLSTSQIIEKGFKDGLIDQLFELLLEYFNIYSHEIAFPELILPAVIQMKNFLKKCKVNNYCKQVKLVLDKAKESSEFIVERRKTVTFNVSDTEAIEAWQNKLKEEGTPVGKYYATWRKMRDRELQHEISGKERMLGTFDLPTVDRSKFAHKATDEDKKEFAALFESDSEDDGKEDRFLLREERKKKTLLKKKPENSDESDEYSDSEDDPEQLEGSARDDESEDESEDEETKSEKTGSDVINVSNMNDSDDENVDKEDMVEDLVLSSDED